MVYELRKYDSFDDFRNEDESYGNTKICQGAKAP